MTGEAEIGVVGPQVKERLQAPQVEQAKNRFSPAVSRERERVQPDFFFFTFNF